MHAHVCLFIHRRCHIKPSLSRRWAYCGFDQDLHAFHSHRAAIADKKKSHIGSTRLGLAQYQNCTDTSTEKANGDVYIGDWVSWVRGIVSLWNSYVFHIEYNENAATAHDPIEWRKSIFFSNKYIGIDSIGWMFSFVARAACQHCSIHRSNLWKWNWSTRS